MVDFQRVSNNTQVYNNSQINNLRLPVQQSVNDNQLAPKFQVRKISNFLELISLKLDFKFFLI